MIALGAKNPKVLLFHNVSPDENRFVAGLGTTMEPATFAAHLAYLVKHYDVVGIDDLVAEPGNRPRVAIAFDDGYRSVLTEAWPLLKQHGLTAIVYLITRAVGNRELVWVDHLNWLLQESGEDGLAAGRAHFGLPPSAGAAQIVSAARVGFDRASLARLIERLSGMAPASPLDTVARDPLYLGWDEVREMAREGAMFGNHTASHPNMGRLPEGEQRVEILEAQQTLKENGVETEHFAYPFGHHNDLTPRIAREAGLRWIAEVGGSNLGPAETGIGRVDVRARNTAELFAQVEIVEPVKSFLRRVLQRPKAGWEPVTAA